MTPNFASCDLCDAHKTDLSGNFRVLPPVMRDFGALRKFCGPVVTVKCFEDNTLVKALARAFRWKRMLEAGEFATIAELAEREGIAPSYMTRVLRLTLLAPDIVEAILDETLPENVSLFDLAIDTPLAWDEQRRRVGKATLRHRDARGTGPGR